MDRKQLNYNTYRLTISPTHHFTESPTHQLQHYFLYNPHIVLTQSFNPHANRWPDLRRIKEGRRCPVKRHHQRHWEQRDVPVPGAGLFRDIRRHRRGGKSTGRSGKPRRYGRGTPSLCLIDYRHLISSHLITPYTPHRGPQVPWRHREEAGLAVRARGGCLLRHQSTHDQ